MNVFPSSSSTHYEHWPYLAHTCSLELSVTCLWDPRPLEGKYGVSSVPFPLSEFCRFLDQKISKSKKSVKNKNYTRKKKVELSLFQKHNDQIGSSKSTGQISLFRSKATLSSSSIQLQSTKEWYVSSLYSTKSSIPKLTSWNIARLSYYNHPRSLDSKKQTAPGIPWSTGKHTKWSEILLYIPEKRQSFHLSGTYFHFLLDFFAFCAMLFLKSGKTSKNQE